MAGERCEELLGFRPEKETSFYGLLLMSAVSTKRADGRQKRAEEEHLKTKYSVFCRKQKSPTTLQECANTWQSVVSESPLTAVATIVFSYKNCINNWAYISQTNLKQQSNRKSSPVYVQVHCYSLTLSPQTGQTVSCGWSTRSANAMFYLPPFKRCYKNTAIRFAYWSTIMSCTI